MEELESYLTAPRKTYRDYRNQKMLYDLGATILKRLGQSWKIVIGIIDYGLETYPLSAGH